MNKNKILTSAFGWLFIGLLICFASSYTTTQIPSIWNAVNSFGFVIASIVVELALVIILSIFIKKLNPIMAKLLYLVYCMVTGCTLSWVLLYYTSASICLIFLATSIIFGIFAIIGKTTKIDLSKFGTYLMIALIACVIVTIINIFIGSNQISIILSIVSILIFSGFIAYDVKFALEKASYIGENAGIYCAFQLFIDFINIFLDLLRLFGESKD